MKLDKNAFVIISVIGQDLLACNYHAASVVVLESALRIGTCSLKLRGSVFSALSSAHWGLKNSDQAIAYMQQDLSVAKSLGKISFQIDIFFSVAPFVCVLIRQTSKLTVPWLLII